MTIPTSCTWWRGTVVWNSVCLIVHCAARCSLQVFQEISSMCFWHASRLEELAGPYTVLVQKVTSFLYSKSMLGEA